MFESCAMQDVEQNEGLKMIHIPCINGKADFKSGARQLVGLVRDSKARKKWIDGNEVAKRRLGMNEIAFAFYTVAYCLQNSNS